MTKRNSATVSPSQYAGVLPAAHLAKQKGLGPRPPGVLAATAQKSRKGDANGSQDQLILSAESDGVPMLPLSLLVDDTQWHLDKIMLRLRADPDSLDAVILEHDKCVAQEHEYVEQIKALLSPFLEPSEELRLLLDKRDRLEAAAEALIQAEKDLEDSRRIVEKHKKLVEHHRSLIEKNGARGFQTPITLSSTRNASPADSPVEGGALSPESIVHAAAEAVASSAHTPGATTTQSTATAVVLPEAVVAALQTDPAALRIKAGLIRLEREKDALAAQESVLLQAQRRYDEIEVILSDSLNEEEMLLLAKHRDEALLFLVQNPELQAAITLQQLIRPFELAQTLERFENHLVNSQLSSADGSAARKSNAQLINARLTMVAGALGINIPPQGTSVPVLVERIKYALHVTAEDLFEKLLRAKIRADMWRRHAVTIAVRAQLETVAVVQYMLAHQGNPPATTTDAVRFLVGRDWPQIWGGIQQHFHSDEKNIQKAAFDLYNTLSRRVHHPAGVNIEVHEQDLDKVEFHLLKQILNHLYPDPDNFDVYVKWE